MYLLCQLLLQCDFLIRHRLGRIVFETLLEFVVFPEVRVVLLVLLWEVSEDHAVHFYLGFDLGETIPNATNIPLNVFCLLCFLRRRLPCLPKIEQSDLDLLLYFARN